MKDLLALAISLLALAQLVPSAQSEASLSITDFVQGLQEIIDSFRTAETSDVADTLVDHPAVGDTKINLAYKVLLEQLGKKIPTLTKMQIPTMGNSTGALYVENVAIYGANNTIFGFDAPGNSYNIENLTLSIPYLDIFGDSYSMNNLNLLDMVTLDGQGPFHIRLEGLFLHCKLLVKYRSLKFVVEHVPIFEVALAKASVYFKNIGNGGLELEKMLNSIAADILPMIVEALHNDVQAAQQDPDVWAATEPQFNKLFTTVLNTLKESLT